MIRTVTPADHARLLDLWEQLMANGHAADARFAPTPDARAVMKDWSRSAWFDLQPFPRVLAWDEDGLRAFVCGFPRAALPVVALDPTVRIGDLYVEASHRGRGIGRQLVQALLSRAADAGYTRAEVGTLTADERAVGFWTAVGFEPWQVHLSRPIG